MSKTPEEHAARILDPADAASDPTASDADAPTAPPAPAKRNPRANDRSGRDDRLV